MADKTIDQLDPGGAAEAPDTLPIERGGLNYFLTVSAIAAFVNANLNVGTNQGQIPVLGDEIKTLAALSNLIYVGNSSMTDPKTPNSVKTIDQVAAELLALIQSSGTVQSVNAGTGTNVTGTATAPVVNVNVGIAANQIPQLDANAKMPAAYGGTMKASDSWGRTTPLVTTIDAILANYSNNIPITPGATLELEMTGDTPLDPNVPIPLVVVAQPSADGQKVILPTMSFPGKKHPLSIGQEFSVINVNEDGYNIEVVDNNLTSLQVIKPLEMYNFVVQDNTTTAGEFLPYGRFLFPSSPTRGLLLGVVTLNTDDLETTQTAVNKFLNPQTILQTPDAYADSRLDKVITDTQLMNLNTYSTHLAEEWNAGDERILCPIGYLDGGVLTFNILALDSTAGASRFGASVQISFSDVVDNQFDFNILKFKTDGVLFATIEDFLNNFSFKAYSLNSNQGLFTIMSNSNLPTDQGFNIYLSMNSGTSLYKQVTPFVGKLISNLPFPIANSATFIPDVFATQETGAQEEFTWTPVDATGTLTFPLAIGRGVKRGNEVELFCTVQYPTTSSSQYVQIKGWDTALNPGDNNNAGICITTTASSSTNNYPNGVTTLSDRLALRCNGAVVPLSAVSGQRLNCKISYWLDT